MAETRPYRVRLYWVAYNDVEVEAADTEEAEAKALATCKDELPWKDADYTGGNAGRWVPAAYKGPYNDWNEHVVRAEVV